MTNDVLSAFSLEGKVAVVTGGASGIGEATAQVLAGAGASVVVGDIALEGAEQTVKSILDAGGHALAHATDVTSRRDVDALVARAVEEYGHLDVMCNVAGVAADGPALDIDEADFDRLMAINAKGVMFGAQAAARQMIEQDGGGSIINVSSTSIDTPAPGYALYAMTKAAVAQLTITMAFELGRHGIRVNTVAPGMTITPFTLRHSYDEDGNLDQDKYDEFVRRMSHLSPLRMVGEAIDQAHLMLYLASDAARWCTGQVWRVNGGQSMPR
jgi:3-oxoacyl-[acyl-carrier protein] reductase